MKTLPKPIEFVWDKGNSAKNQKKHNVTDQEAEESFTDEKKKIFTDHIHSGKEERFRVVGKTKNRRLLFIVFTIRNKRVRIISARDTNKKEVDLYEKTTYIAKI